MIIILRRINRSIVLLLYYLKEMVKANGQLARDILSPRLRIQPGIVKVHIHTKSDTQTLLLFNLITMTPGSFCLDVSKDLKSFYVHGLHVKNHDDFEKQITEGIEKQMMEVVI